MLSPFGPSSSNKQTLKERFAAREGNSNLNIPQEYTDKSGSAHSSHRTQAMVEKYGGAGIKPNKYRKEGSSLNMRREDSDMSLNNGTSSLDQKAVDTGNLSPPDRKRKTNVHL